MGFFRSQIYYSAFDIGHKLVFGVKTILGNAFSIYVEGSYLILITPLIEATPLALIVFFELRKSLWHGLNQLG